MENLEKLMKSNCALDVQIGFEILKNLENKKVLEFFKKYTQRASGPDGLDTTYFLVLKADFFRIKEHRDSYYKKGAYYLYVCNNYLMLDHFKIAHRYVKERGFKIFK